MFWWCTKLTLSVALVIHSVTGHLGYMAFMPQPPAMFAIILILAGGSINLYHYRLVKRDNPDISRPRNLVTRGGLFGRCRHPMYLGDLTWCLGVALYPFSGVSALLYVSLLPVIVFLAEYEDQKLAGIFGDEFRDWRSRSGLLVPRLG